MDHARQAVGSGKHRIYRGRNLEGVHKPASNVGATRETKNTYSVAGSIYSVVLAVSAERQVRFELTVLHQEFVTR